MKKLLLILLLITSVLFLKANEDRELRSIWIATAWGGIDWPTTKITDNTDLTQIASQQSELIDILNNALLGNINTVFFQVRGHADALYNSSYEPWSHCLTTTRGINPGYDPLAFIIEEAHKRGIEVHAWINPYRVSNYTPQSSYIQSSWIIGSGGSAFLDPGNPQVQQYTLNVINEIIDNYDIDGIVFDDYFYKSMPENSYATNETHQNSANNPHGLSINDWRRENVNQLIKAVFNSITTKKPYLRFGISPFGIYSTSSQKVYDENYTTYDVISPASGIVGQDAYSVLYCDAAAWLKRGYIDYISPQLYWPSLSTTPTYNSGQDYETLCTWWYNLANKYNRPLITSNDVANNNSNGTTNKRFNTPEDIENQITINRNSTKSEGAVFYNTTYYQNKSGVNTHFNNNEGYHTLLPEELYKEKTLWPIISWRGTTIDDPIITNIRIINYSLQWESNANNIRYAVYYTTNNNPICNNLTLKGISYTTEFNISNYSELTSGKWIIRGLDRYGNLYSEHEIGETTNEEIIEKEKDYNLYTDNNKITIEVNNQKQITIFTIEGKIIYNNTIQSSIDIELSRGIYIIVIEENREKIIIP